MSRATEDTLDTLHGAVADNMLEQLRAYKRGEYDRYEVNAEGQKVLVERATVPPALLAQIAKFLKDNGVDTAVRAGDPLDTLMRELPKLEQEPLYG